MSKYNDIPIFLFKLEKNHIEKKND